MGSYGMPLRLRRCIRTDLVVSHGLLASLDRLGATVVLDFSLAQGLCTARTMTRNASLRYYAFLLCSAADSMLPFVQRHAAARKCNDCAHIIPNHRDILAKSRSVHPCILDFEVILPLRSNFLHRDQPKLAGALVIRMLPIDTCTGDRLLESARDTTVAVFVTYTYASSGPHSQYRNAASICAPSQVL